MRVRARFIVALALAIGALVYSGGLSPETLRPACHLHVSWTNSLDAHVPRALDEVTAITGQTWERVPEGGDIRISQETLGGMYAGLAYNYRLGPFIRHAEVVIDDRARDPYATVRHEIIHAVGYVAHSEDPHSAMYPYLGGEQDLTPEDREILADLGSRCHPF